jgi:hypothetical protein
MNRRSLVVLVLGFLLSSVALSAQSRAEKPNDFTLGLGGQCLLYNLAYQRNLTPNFALDIGVSYLGAGASLDESGSVFFLSGGARFYMLKKDASPYLSGGVVWVTADTDAGPLDGEGNFYGYVSPGFEFRSMGGFVFRGGVYLLFIKGAFLVWPGISLGIAF